MTHEADKCTTHLSNVTKKYPRCSPNEMWYLTLLVPILHSPNKGSHNFGNLKSVAFTIIYKFCSNSCDSLDVIFGKMYNTYLLSITVVYFAGKEAINYLCVSFKSLEPLLWITWSRPTKENFWCQLWKTRLVTYLLPVNSCLVVKRYDYEFCLFVFVWSYRYFQRISFRLRPFLFHILFYGQGG